MSIRLIAELLGGLGLIAVIIFLWMGHDKKEVAIGTLQCQSAISTTASTALADTNDTNQDNADILSKTVATYDDKIRALNARNGSLAQRVHDYETQADLRGGQVPGVPGTAGKLPSAHGDPGVTARDRREAETLSACAATTIELNEIRNAWAELHERSVKGEK